MRSGIRRLARLVLSVVLLAAVLAAGAVGYAAYRFKAPGPSAEETVVLVPRGTGPMRIADLLAEAGVVDDPFVFLAGVRVTGNAGRLRAGEYAFPAAVSAEEAMEILVEGRTIRHFFTAAEGLTAWEIVERLRADDRLTGEIADVPPEGSLLPETYQFMRGDTRQSLIDRMRADMESALAEAWEGRADGLPLSSPQEVLILASIIEKETGVASERELVASVFVNRLVRGMPLQTDPTVIYAITRGEGPLGRALLRRDLEVDDPYNTYRHPGLPPGPIANPGRASLEAAVNPAESPYYYFVADGTGGHAFAETLAEHNRNVAAWRAVRSGAGSN